jgi:hypothetical protein
VKLESLLTHDDGFRLTTATALQRAICRAETGEPLDELADRPEVVEAFGGRQALGLLQQMGGSPPALVCLLAAIRSAKSLKVACKAFRATQTCDLSRLRDGEKARYSIVSLDIDKARATFEHLVGSVKASPLLSKTILSERAESIDLMHPSGHAVEVKVVAGKKAGGSLVSRWSIAVAFDEAPRMQGQTDGVVNLPDALSAIRGRMLPGAQIDLLGSPWAPRGPIYDLYIDRFGRPGTDALFMVAKGPDMNPFHFTPELCAQLQRDDPRAYRTDVLALFADPEDSLLSSIDVEACCRKSPEHLEPNDQEHVAAIDPANRRNAWTLTIGRPSPSGTPEIAYSRQWLGSKSAPLKSSRVFAEIRPILELYKIEGNSLWTDQASFDDKYELAQQQGIALMADPFTDAEWKAHATALEKVISEHSIELPPNAAMRADILGIQKRLTARSWHIILPNTGDGRHGDYVPSLVLALKHLPSPRNALDLSAMTMDDDERRICDLVNSSRSNPIRAAAQRLHGVFQ